MYRYLVIRAEDPLECLERINLYFVAVAGLRFKAIEFNIVGIYDDIIALGVPRDLVGKARALVALLDGCRTVKVRGTVKSARRTAMSIRRRRPNA
ncbi:MAG: hypothetical protein AT715_09285 [Thermoproteus sp. JCHS_4]|jgi:hypothetical protein|nr:MAG: hypothetical protein AT711_03870 [Thermoproteus sp. CIS_19]KUO87552.1 MAG: hypothetical protein AT715_09285 [Thermoproteus sp. JCHS_4]